MPYSKVNDLWLLYTSIYYNSPLVFSVAKTHNYKIAKWLSKTSSDDVFLYCLNNVFHIIITYIRSSWQAKANFEEGFGYAIEISGIVLIDWLLVHWFPNWTALNLLGEHEDTEGLNILVGLTIGGSTIHCLKDRGTGHCPDCFKIVFEIFEMIFLPIPVSRWS